MMINGYGVVMIMAVVAMVDVVISNVVASVSSYGVVIGYFFFLLGCCLLL